MRTRTASLFVLLLLLIIVGCLPQAASVPFPPTTMPTLAPNQVNVAPCATGALQIILTFSLNDQQNYMTPAVERFNSAYAEGRHPLTGAALMATDFRICVIAQLISSSTATQGLVNAIIAPNNENVVRTTLFSPTVSTWLALANYRSGRELFDMSRVQPVGLTPVIIAIWQSRLEAIRATVGRDDIGWADLLSVLNAPNGWQDFGIPDGRRAVFYGHTDPRSSSTGLSAVISEYYASAAMNGFSGRRLTLQQVNDPAVQDGVRQIEQLVRHYASRTDEYLDYIAQGPDYVDFVALEENDLLYLKGAFSANGFTPPFTPPEPLMALYPREGTLWHERPIAIVNADWVTPEQASAAQVFIDYLLSEEVQQTVLQRGFRPVNAAVPLSFPIVPEFGADPAQPVTVLDMPDAETIVAIQQNWSLVKKPADLLLVIDVSGSMLEEDKIGQARTAALAFIDGLESNSRVGLAVFSDTFRLLNPIDELESNREALRASIQGLQADGGTALFDAMLDSLALVNDLDDATRIRAIVLLSDGADTNSTRAALGDVIRQIDISEDSANPVIVVPVAYGQNADISILGDIGRASNTRVQSGNPDDIGDVLELIRSFF